MIMSTDEIIDEERRKLINKDIEPNYSDAKIKEQNEIYNFRI